MYKRYLRNFIILYVISLFIFTNILLFNNSMRMETEFFEANNIIYSLQNIASNLEHMDSNILYEYNRSVYFMQQNIRSDKFNDFKEYVNLVLELNSDSINYSYEDKVVLGILLRNSLSNVYGESSCKFKSNNYIADRIFMSYHITIPDNSIKMLKEFKESYNRKAK